MPRLTGRASYSRILWALLALFCARVLGQLLVATSGVSFLPPMEEWFSGLIPYTRLLASQLVIIVLLAPSPESLPQTVISRCQVIELHAVPREEIEQGLIEQGGADPDNAAQLARLAGGRPGRRRQGKPGGAPRRCRRAVGS